jgi:ubiquinone/menaquinone biosynthesis C-methylase UbiE
VDWDRGAYEDTAAELAPAAAHVVQRARIEEGHTVLDLGTGTGNAAALAAEAGAHVTAIDPSPRLLEVARERVGAGRFGVATAEDLPFNDKEFDRVLSLFAVIFSEEPERAASEIVRVLKPDGKALITSWEPVGPMHEALGILGRATSEAAGRTENRYPWGEPDKVTALFGDAEVTAERARIAFEAPSAEDYMARFETRHPAGMLFKDALTRSGDYAAKRAEAVAALGPGQPLRVTSTYFVFTIEPRPAG